jgi:hypothetical protein
MVSFISSPFTFGRPRRHALLALAAAATARNQCGPSESLASESASALNAPSGTNVGQFHEADAPRMVAQLHSLERGAPKHDAGRARQQSLAHLPAPLQPPNPSLQPTRYGWLRQPPRAAELKR